MTLNVKVDDYVIYVTTNMMTCFGCGQMGQEPVLKLGKNPDSAGATEYNARDSAKTGAATTGLTTETSDVQRLQQWKMMCRSS